MVCTPSGTLGPTPRSGTVGPLTSAGAQGTCSSCADQRESPAGLIGEGPGDRCQPGLCPEGDGEPPEN